MEDRGGVTSWLSKVPSFTGLSSYLSQLMRGSEPSAQLKNVKPRSCRGVSSALDVDLFEAGGVEVMNPFTDEVPRRSLPARNVSVVKYGGTPRPRPSQIPRTLSSSHQPKKILVCTLDDKDDGNDRIDIPVTPTTVKTKDIGKILSSRQQSTPAITKSKVSLFEPYDSAGTGASRYVKIGGNDGLTESEDEEMDGIEDENSDRHSTSSVEMLGQFKSPGTSQFRFRPTITSTDERKPYRSASRKENRFNFKNKHLDSGSSIPRQYRGALWQPSSSVGRRRPLRGASLVNSSFQKSLRFGSIMNTFNRGVVRDRISGMGLSEAYFSSAMDCYKPVDKQHYRELVKRVAALGSSFSCSNSTNNFSTSSVVSVPVAKTVMSADWARKKAMEIEQQEIEKKQRETSNEISLWTSDQDKMKPGTSVSFRGSSGSSKELSDSDFTKQTSVPIEDDEIMITKENVKKVVPLNSFELHPKFRALHKFTEGWLQDVKSRRLEREAKLERPLRESQETLKIGQERRLKAPSVEDIVSRRFQMLDMRHPSALVEVEKEDVLVELTPQMEHIISNALRKNPPGEVLTEKFNIQITRRDIATLDGLNWLNDEVVNFYMNLIMERSKNDNFQSVYAFNTFFYPKLIKMGFSGVKRWTKKVDIFSHDLLLVPVHLGMHWCLATINTKDKVITYYDSMLGDNAQCLHELRKYLGDEMLDKKKTSLDLSVWKFETPKDIPQQMNGSDCGMFACKFSEYLSRKAPITFTQDHMPYFRRRMVYEIVTNKLL